MKPPIIAGTLANNKEKLLKFLEEFHNEKGKEREAILPLVHYVSQLLLGFVVDRVECLFDMFSLVLQLQMMSSSRRRRQ